MTDKCLYKWWSTRCSKLFFVHAYNKAHAQKLLIVNLKRKHSAIFEYVELDTIVSVV